MKSLTKEQKAIVEKFQNNFNKLTFAQQSIFNRILDRDNQFEFQDYASAKYVVNFYEDYHSDYYDAY